MPTGRPSRSAPRIEAAWSACLPRRAGSSSRKHSRLRQPRHRHVDDLALAERHPADRELRRVGVDLDRPGLSPGAQALEVERRPLGADEVRDAPGRAREPGDAADLHLAPDAVARLGLRQHVRRRASETPRARRDGPPHGLAEARGGRSRWSDSLRRRDAERLRASKVLHHAATLDRAWSRVNPRDASRWRSRARTCRSDHGRDRDPSRDGRRASTENVERSTDARGLAMRAGIGRQLDGGRTQRPRLSWESPPAGCSAPAPAAGRRRSPPGARPGRSAGGDPPRPRPGFARRRPARACPGTDAGRVGSKVGASAAEKAGRSARARRARDGALPPRETRRRCSAAPSNDRLEIRAVGRQPRDDRREQHPDVGCPPRRVPPRRGAAGAAARCRARGCRQRSGSSVVRLTHTDTPARSRRAASTSRSRITIGPFVTTLAGVLASASASRIPRVSR